MNQATMETDQDGVEREVYWRTKLRRLRFESEPLADQVAKYRRVTIVLTAVAGGVALLFLLIFTAFRRPDVALILDAILFAPIILVAWADFWRLARNVRAYELERKKKVL